MGSTRRSFDFDIIRIGANQTEATKISIIYGISLVLIGIIGGIFWVFVNNKKKMH